MMDQQYARNTNIGVGVGIVLQILGRMIVYGGGALWPLGWLVAVAGTVFFIWGCCNYAMGKGYPWPVGLLGLLSCIGLIVLIVLPRKN